MNIEKLAEMHRKLSAAHTKAGVTQTPPPPELQPLAAEFAVRVFEAFPAIVLALRSDAALPSCSRMDPITHKFFISQAERDAGEAGFTISALANAVQIWSCMQGPQISVAVAARAFNCEPALIAEAVREHHWMFLTTKSGHLLDEQDHIAGGPQHAAIDDYAAVFIEHEGE